MPSRKTKNDVGLQERVNRLYSLHKSQRVVARKLRVSQSTVSRLLAGKIKKTKITKGRVARATKQTIRGDKFLAQIVIKYRWKARERDKFETRYARSLLFRYSEKMYDKVLTQLQEKLLNPNGGSDGIIVIDSVSLIRYGYNKKNPTTKLRKL